MRYPNPQVAPILINEIALDNNGGIVSITYQQVDSDAIKANGVPNGPLKKISVSNKDYKVEGEGIAEKVGSWLQQAIDKKSPIRKKVSELTYYDLLADYHFCNGIYIFFSRDEQENVTVDYIGKTTSRAVVDRMGSHLDLRDSGFLNCLIKRIAQNVYLGLPNNSKVIKNTPVSPCDMNIGLSSELTYNKIGDMFFVFLPVYQPICCPVKTNATIIGKLESLLIKAFKQTSNNEKPTYNY